MDTLDALAPEFRNSSRLFGVVRFVRLLVSVSGRGCLGRLFSFRSFWCGLLSWCLAGGRRRRRLHCLRLAPVASAIAYELGLRLWVNLYLHGRCVEGS